MLMIVCLSDANALYPLLCVCADGKNNTRHSNRHQIVPELSDLYFRVLVLAEGALSVSEGMLNVCILCCVFAQAGQGGGFGTPCSFGRPVTAQE